MRSPSAAVPASCRRRRARARQAEAARDGGDAVGERIRDLLADEAGGGVAARVLVVAWLGCRDELRGERRTSVCSKPSAAA